MIRNFDGTDLVTSGANVFLSAEEELGAQVVYILRQLLTEDFLDQSKGTPWFNGILGKTDAGVIEILLKQAVLQCADVTDITDFDITQDRATRTYSVSMTITNQTGTTATVTYTA
ncbi:hypothetical protein [Pseudomonas sp. dw_358]|uniref:hypothetical protein n=1 Tax=Pseudomonas sp. dw_358 TaxID=2720083 RepID=UPI001BD430EF|nr:hypothetical protein [Pseudomonas sp. dw_358]